MIPWKFFDLTARDQTGVLLLGIHRMNTKTQNAADITQLLFTVPAENALLVTSYSIEGDTAGAGILPITAEFQVRDASGNVLSSLVQNLATGFNSVGAVNQLCGITGIGSPVTIAGPGMQIWGRVRFSFPDPTNHLQHAINGVLIPRGTMAYQT